MQDDTIFPEKGTPQDGVLYPLLANIALNGIGDLLSDWVVEIPVFSPLKVIESPSEIAVKDYFMWDMLTILLSYILTNR